MSELKDELLKDYQKRYWEGGLDTVSAIQKALITTKITTGQYPTMEDLIYKLLPEMKEFNLKCLKELESDV